MSTLELKPVALDFGRCPLILGKHPGDFLDYIVDGVSLYSADCPDMIGCFGSWIHTNIQMELAQFFLGRIPPDKHKLHPQLLYEGNLLLFVCPCCADEHCGTSGCRLVRLNNSYVWTDFWPKRSDGMLSRSFRFPAELYENIFEELARGKHYDFSQRVFVHPRQYVHMGALPYPWNEHHRMKPPSVKPEDSDEQKIHALEWWLDTYGFFHYATENELRHLWGARDSVKASFYVDDILQNRFMDEYQLNTLSNWLIGNDDAAAVEVLLGKASEFEQFKYISAACRIKAAEILAILNHLDQSRQQLQIVASCEDPELFDYSGLAKSRLD